MYGLATIRRMNAEADAEARPDGKKPVSLERISGFGKEQIPYLGDACADFDTDYTRLETLFVDISGFGRDDEPALSLKQFKDKLETLIKENGAILVALEEVGQFQGYAAVWKA